MWERQGSSVWGTVLLAAASLTLVYCGESAKNQGGSETGRVSARLTPVDTISQASMSTTIVGPVSYADAESAYTEKRFDEAVTRFKGYTATKPENPWGHYMLGLSAWKVRDFDQAESELLKAIELDSTHVKSRINLARVYLDKGEPGKAEEQVQVVVKLDSASGEAFRLLGRVRDDLKMYPEAEEAYRTAIEIDSTDVWAMNNLGLNLIKQGKLETSVEVLTKVTEIKPESPTFQNNLGMALELNGRFTDATKAYQEAVNLDAKYQKAVDNLARVTGLKDKVVTPS